MSASEAPAAEDPAPAPSPRGRSPAMSQNLRFDRRRLSIEAPNTLANRVIVRVEQVRPFVPMSRQMNLFDPARREARQELRRIEAVVAGADEDVVHAEQQAAV